MYSVSFNRAANHWSRASFRALNFVAQAMIPRISLKYTNRYMIVVVVVVLVVVVQEEVFPEAAFGLNLKVE
jgi:hypothetical protein